MKPFKLIFPAVLASFFFCSNLENVSGPELQYPAGWPQSAAEVARLFDSLPALMQPVKIDTPSTDGLVMVSLTKPHPQSGKGTELVFSACTTSSWPHCTGLETVYAETTSSVFGISASTGSYFSGNYGGYIVLIHGKYNSNGQPGEKRVYFESWLIDSVHADEVKVLLGEPRHLLIFKSWGYRSPQCGYQVYDRVSDKLVNYGFY